jgi:polypyrimidine tract-binding protein 2
MSSQVLHLRNLPYETTEDELREICAPFGSLVQTKLSVGPNKNQAFVEFGDVTSAMNMVNYYISSADTAKVGSFLV